MNKLYLICACGLLALSCGAFAADAEFPGISTYAEQIRKGEVDVGKRYDMNDKKGRFHMIHSEELDLNCESCHVAKDYAKDYLLVNRENAHRKALGDGKGDKADVLDRSVCLGCHKTGGVATAWYQTADK